MKKINIQSILMLSLFAALILTAQFYKQNKVADLLEMDGMEADISGMAQWMNKMLADPSTGKIPDNFRRNEIAFSSLLPSLKNTMNKSFGYPYTVRGPWNVGGRTRAVVIDKTNENILMAGSTMGGFWRSTDGGVSWKRCADSALASNITCLAQDTRTGKTNTWYAGTGELYGSYVPGSFFSGNGVYKSTDQGLTWKQLPATATSPGGLYNSWSIVTNIATNTAIDSLDVIFVATYNWIWRSLDGGKTFSPKKGGGGNLWSDVAVTSKGIVYATLSSGSTGAGIWRSIDNGNTWTNISPIFFASTTQRIVIGISPSDENQIYFAAYSPGTGKKSLNFEKTEEWNSLWKYTYVSGNGSGAGGVWDNRSANIPTLGGAFGDFISQQGYCLSIKVKPDNPNVVFLGGANLYRSSDGFTSTNNTTWIGGYDVNTTLPDYKVYPNHHPDNHGVVFYPSNPAKMISLDDGGIQITTNNLAPTIVWTPLNTGYLCTQFYTVAIDHTSNSNVIIGGLQDNGTYYTNNQNVYASWAQPFNSDGSFCFVGPNATESYMSGQQGRVARVLLDANGNRTQMARIDPPGIDKNKYDFINPFTPDANNWKKVYITAYDRIWRNDDVSQIPLHPQLDSNRVLTNWNELVKTKMNDSLSAIFSSKIQNDVLYYGSQNGKLFRLRNASSDSSVPENISGTNFPANAYINCIAQHPTDSNKLFVVFTNYGILSIFYSADAGTTWAAVSGNLEQNVNGTGNGPSCRWLTIANIGDSLIYFVGTSTGLYATKVLNGMQTVWTNQSPDIIGNSIVTMMDFRSTDGMFVVSTFGNGIFSTKIQSFHEGISEKNMLKDQIKIYPNPVDHILKIDFTQKYFQTTFEIFDVKGELVMHGMLTQLTNSIDVSELKTGIYFVNINEDGKSLVLKVMKE
jgi:Secretion system C-terminal sorting domain